MGTLRIDELTPLAAGGAGVAGPFLDKGGAVFDAEAEGITPDGATDRLSALQALNSQAAAAGKAILLKSGAGYVLSGTWSPTVPLVCADKEPAVFRPNGAFRALEFQGSASGASTTLAASVEMNQDRISVTSAAGFTVGQLVRIQSNALWYYDNRGTAVKGETHLIRHISGTTLYLDTQTWDSYDTGVETVTVVGYNPISPYLENVAVEYATSTAVGGAVFGSCLRPRWWGGGVTNANLTGLGLVSSYDADIQGITIFGANNTGTGYGIQDNASYGTRIRDIRTAGCRRGVDFSGAYSVRGALVTGSRFQGGGLAHDGSDLFAVSAGFAAHGPSEHIRFIGNEVVHCNSGAIVRGGDIEIRDNTFIGQGNTVITATHGTNLRVTDNEYRGNIRPSKATIGSSLNNLTHLDFLFIGADYSWDSSARTIIQGNHAHSVKRAFLSLAPPTSGNVQHLYVLDNFVQILPNTGSLVTNFIRATGALTAVSSLLDVRNVVADGLGTYTRIDGSITLGSGHVVLADYSASNVTTDRAFDANATTLDEIADVVGTLLVDLRKHGIIAP